MDINLLEKMRVCKEEYPHLYENCTQYFVEFQNAIIAKRRILLLCDKLDGIALHSLRTLIYRKVSPDFIICSEPQETGIYAQAVRMLNTNILSYKQYKNISKTDDLLISCCIYQKYSHHDLQSFRFKFEKRIIENDLWSRIDNPLGKHYSTNIVRFEPMYFRIDQVGHTAYWMTHFNSLDYLMDLLADDESKITLMEIIRCYFQNDNYRLKERNSNKKYFEQYVHLKDEYWINCGSCLGDTILWAVLNGYSFKQIDAYEGDKKVFNSLKRNVSMLDIPLKLHNCYIGMADDIKTNFDALYGDENQKNNMVTLINMDIEGAETDVLMGAKKMIARCRPVLAICAYHKPEDLIEIPRIILEATDNYLFYLRKYVGGLPLDMNEYIYYAVPQERVLTGD